MANAVPLLKLVRAERRTFTDCEVDNVLKKIDGTISVAVMTLRLSPNQERCM